MDKLSKVYKLADAAIVLDRHYTWVNDISKQIPESRSKDHSISKGYLVDLDILVPWLKQRYPADWGSYDLAGGVKKLHELRSRATTATNETKPTKLVTEATEPEKVTALAIPEQQAMAMVVKGQRDDLRVSRAELRKVKKSMWSVAGMLVAALIGFAALGWLLTVTSGKLETAEAVTVEKIEHIAGLNERVGGLNSQLDRAAGREAKKQGRIDKLEEMAVAGRLAEKEMTDRIVELHAGWLATEQEASVLRVEIEKMRQDRKVVVGLKVGAAGDR